MTTVEQNRKKNHRLYFILGPGKSLGPELPPLDINLVQFFMQMWQMWNKAGEMAAAHVATMNIVGAAQGEFFCKLYFLNVFSFSDQAFWDVNNENKYFQQLSRRLPSLLHTRTQWIGNCIPELLLRQWFRLPHRPWLDGLLLSFHLLGPFLLLL